LLGPVFEKFVTIAPLEEPAESGEDDQIFITRSYDATSHFETVVDDIHDVWRRATNGKKLELKMRPDDEGAQVQG